jgi:hypothetical protein
MKSYIQLLFEFLQADSELNSKKKFEAYYLNVFEFLYVEIRVIKTKYREKSGDSFDDIIESDLIEQTIEKVLYRLINRKEINDQLKKETPKLNLDSRNELNLSRDIRSWKEEILIWVGQIMNFNPEFNNITAEEVTLQAKKLNDTLLPIHEKGLNLLSWCYPDTLKEQEISDLDTFKNLKNQFDNLFTKISEQKKKEDKSGIEVELGAKGVVDFIESLNIILTDAPLLKIVFKKYLKYIVRTEFINYLRIRNKRNECSIDEYESNGLIFNSIDSKYARVVEDNKGIDPMRQIINSEEPTDLNEFEELIFSLLYKPVKEAEAVFKESKTSQQRQRALKKIEKEEKLYDELCLIIEYQKKDKYTQESIAEEIGLTRDQVRGRLEKIQQLLDPLRQQELQSHE